LGIHGETLPTLLSQKKLADWSSMAEGGETGPTASNYLLPCRSIFIVMLFVHFNFIEDFDLGFMMAPLSRDQLEMVLAKV
jgi:hypothetical protein